MNEPKILTKFVNHPENGKPLFPSKLEIKRGERIAIYDLRYIRVEEELGKRSCDEI